MAWRAGKGMDGGNVKNLSMRAKVECHLSVSRPV